MGARTAFAVLAGALALALAFNGARGIWEPDEGRYTDIATQMLRSGDFMVPAFNHEVPHFAKPPLTYWAIAASVAALGWEESAARLPNALAFAVTVLAVLLLAARLLPGRPALAALVYATSLFPFVAANIVTTDTLLAMWEALAVLGFVSSRGAARPDRGILLMWLALGLGFLTKGPPALLPLLAVVAFVALTDGARSVGRLLHPVGVPLFFLVGFGWYVAVGASHPGLLSYFLRDEVVGRIASGAHRRNAEWYGAFRIYLPVLLAGTLPWTWVLARQAWSARRDLLAGPRAWRRHAGRDPAAVLLAVWVLLPLTVLALSRSRLELYVLPLWVPLALLAARALAGWRPARATAVLLAVWMAGLVGLKWYSGRHVTHRDSRTVAREIRALGLSDLREVLFVGDDPVWGLALYLPGVQLEPVMLPVVRSPLEPPAPGEVENLSQELDEVSDLDRSETPSLLLVRLRDLAPVWAELERRRLRFRPVGTVGGRAALLVE